MKIAFLGTPDISAYVLQELYNSGLDIVWVATQPDRPSGRGRKLLPPPVKEKAIKLGKEVIQAERFDRDLFEKIKTYGQIDLAVVIAYGLYIPSYFLDYPKHSCLNIHFSLLPKYRGAAPVARAIMNGEKETGVTIMKLSREMDAGDMIAQQKTVIDDEDTTETLTWSLVKSGTELLMKTIPSYISGKVVLVPQSSTGITPTYAEKIKAEERKIEWNRPALDIHNQIRALYPWPVSETAVNGTILKLVSARPYPRTADLDENEKPGTVVAVDKRSGFFAVKTMDGALLVEKVQPSGKREMSVSEFMNGHEIKKGMRLE